MHCKRALEAQILANSRVQIRDCVCLHFKHLWMILGADILIDDGAGATVIAPLKANDVQITYASQDTP